MTVEKAIDYVYASYLKAEPYLDYAAPDSEKRNPEYSREIIKKRAGIPTVLVTGSKGKGSVSKMIAEIMGTHHKVGLMTSPHILTFNERIQVQGEPVHDDVLAQAVEQVKPEFEAVEATLAPKEYISPMGIQAAAALEIFKAAGVTFQVMECGKGVAFDDVNNVPHKYGVINRIFLEHTRELGKTLGEIAENKSAIMTGEQDAVFTGKQEEEVLKVLRDRAEVCQTPLYEYGRDFWCEDVRYTQKGMKFDVVTRKNRYEDIQIPLLGTYQAENCALAIALCEMELDVLEEAKVKQALQYLEWPGRLEVLSADPLMLLDACINRESCQNVLEALEQLGVNQVTTIIGIPSDKDYLGVAEAMKRVSAHMILTKSQNAHYKFGTEQVEALADAGIHAEWTESIEEAIHKARIHGMNEQAWDRPICILGTTSLISDVKALAAAPKLL